MKINKFSLKMNVPGSLPISSVGIGYPLTIPEAFDRADLDLPEVIGSGPKRRIDVSVPAQKDTNLLNVFIVGALIFIVIFAWFNIIQLLINIFYESLWRSTTDMATRRDFHIALIKQVTFSFIVTLILYIYFYYFYK